MVPPVHKPHGRPLPPWEAACDVTSSGKVRGRESYGGRAGSAVSMDGVPEETEYHRGKNPSHLSIPCRGERPGNALTYLSTRVTKSRRGGPLPLSRITGLMYKLIFLTNTINNIFHIKPNRLWEKNRLLTYEKHHGIQQLAKHIINCTMHIMRTINK